MTNLPKSRQVARITSISKNSSPKISLSIDNIIFEALFDTGAARSLLYEKIFNQLPAENKKVTGYDVQLFDVHNKILNILGKISLPIKYGNDILEQEFIITNGINEDCILGLDAVFKHEFVLDGKSKILFLSRNIRKKSSENENFNVMTTVKKVIMRPMTMMVVEGKIQDEHLDRSSKPSFMFSPSKDLPKEIYIESFVEKLH